MRIIRLKEVVKKTGLAKSTIYLMIQNSEFPHQVALGKRAVGWNESDVDGWIQTRTVRGTA